MTYSPTIPQAADLLSQSQLDIQTNFSQANTIMGANHVSFNGLLPIAAVLGYAPAVPVDEGKHTIIHTKMINAATALNTVVTTANEGAFLTKEFVAGERVEAMYKYEDSATANVSVQLSAIKAWATFVGNGPFGVVAVLQNNNVTGVTHNSTGSYTVTLSPYVVTSNNFCVLVSIISNSIFRTFSDYSSLAYVPGTGIATFNINTWKMETYAILDASNISFAVIQLGG